MIAVAADKAYLGDFVSSFFLDFGACGGDRVLYPNALPTM